MADWKDVPHWDPALNGNDADDLERKIKSTTKYSPTNVEDDLKTWDAVDFLDLKWSSSSPPESSRLRSFSQMVISPENFSKYRSDHEDLKYEYDYFSASRALTEIPKYTNELLKTKQEGARTSNVTGLSFIEGARSPISTIEPGDGSKNHPLYHNLSPHAVGLYHCPFKDDPKANCTHKPEKLRCNYEYDIQCPDRYPC